MTLKLYRKACGSLDSIAHGEPMTIAELPTDPVHELFEYWKTVMGHKRARLDLKRRRLIKDRINDGYTFEDLMLAIEGCYLDPWNMGEDPRSNGQRYDDISLICRDAEHIDKFIKRAEKAQERMEKINAQRAVKEIEQQKAETFDLDAARVNIAAVRERLAGLKRASAK